MTVNVEDADEDPDIVTEAAGLKLVVVPAGSVLTPGLTLRVTVPVNPRTGVTVAV